ncbi:hypothetical protein M5K25_000234 [Dendrobium thyrsiflorum]|uniref:NB-ARC domain-containing protein n=1 Tax=Dendrobium thyrsiflorum TaxID=117978 RepID=A0ABD0W729_DENTH
MVSSVEAKEFVMQWLRKPSLILCEVRTERTVRTYESVCTQNEYILLKNVYTVCTLTCSDVGHGGMGKTVLLQHVYKDEITKEFDLKMWVYVLKNFDVKKIIALFTPK